MEEEMESVEPPVVATETPFVITVTGHRPDKLGGYSTPNELYDLVLKGLVDAFNFFKPAYVITGMSLGTDQWAAELCFNMGIPFVAAIPFNNQDAKWFPHSKQHYHWLLSKAYAKYVICEGEYAPWKMQKRNEWMVQSCHQVVAVWNGTTGGTKNCLEAAARLKKPVHYVPLPPAGMSVGEFFHQHLSGEGKGTPLQGTEFLPRAKEAPASVVPTVTKRIVEL
jgi:uncharacterized phage-like protein YoqJ